MLPSLTCPPRPTPTAAVVSMGTEISEDDVANILNLCDQVIALSEYRAQVRAARACAAWWALG